MIRKIARIMLVVLFFLLVLAEAKEVALRTIKLTQRDNGKTINMYVGDRVEIQLPGLGAVPFQRKIEITKSAGSYHPEIIIDSGYSHVFENLVDRQGNILVGGGGMETWWFHAVDEGKTNLIFYLEPINNKAESKKTKSFAVTIISKFLKPEYRENFYKKMAK